MRAGRFEVITSELELHAGMGLEQVRSVLAIPIKKTESRLVNYLSVEEMKALLNGPDPNTRSGIRDRGMLQLAVEAGLRHRNS